MDEDAVTALGHIAVTDDLETRLVRDRAGQFARKGSAQHADIELHGGPEDGSHHQHAHHVRHPRILQDSIAALCYLTASAALRIACCRRAHDGCHKCASERQHGRWHAWQLGHARADRHHASELVRHPAPYDVVSKLESLTEVIIDGWRAVDSTTEEICHARYATCARTGTRKARWWSRVPSVCSCGSRAPIAEDALPLGAGPRAAVRGKTGRRALMELRASRTLITLSNTPGEDTRCQCAIALGLLCSDNDAKADMHRVALIDEGAAVALIQLAELPVPRASGLHEALCRLCAVASCHPQLLDEGLLPRCSGWPTAAQASRRLITAARARIAR